MEMQLNRNYVPFPLVWLHEEEENTTNRRCIALYPPCTLCVPFTQRPHTLKISSIDVTYPLMPNQITRDNLGVFSPYLKWDQWSPQCFPLLLWKEYFTLLRSSTTLIQRRSHFPYETCIVSRHPTLNYFKITLLPSMHITSHPHHNHSLYQHHWRP